MVIISPISSDEDEIVCPPILGSLPTVFNLKDGLETARNKGMKHFKHEHGLEFKEYVGNVRCMGCGHEMGGRGFSCMEHCYFHLHEICALFPEVITNYPDHDPQHLLKLKDSEKKCCDICDRHLQWEFSYNCSICDFDVDLRCTSMYLSFCGGRHRHELISKLYLASSLCYLCGEKHGELGMFYECRSCSFLIHERCYYLHDCVQDDRHIHPLHISEFRRGFKQFCDICMEDIVNAVISYNCEECNLYNVHIKCFYKNWDKNIIEIPLGKEDEIVCPPNLGSFLNVFNLKDGLKKARDKGIKHFKHEHGLNFKEYVSDVLCKGCGNEIGGRGFSCMRHCGFHLHEICALCPEEITNYPLHHLEHPLTLKISEAPRQCNDCKNVVILGLFYYDCNDCNFQLDLRCAAILFPFCGDHHEHELTANICPASFSCSFCGEKHGELGMSFECKRCSFWIHEQCYYLPDTIQHDCHKHPLHITIHTGYVIKCGVCEEKKSNFFHTYYCGRCNYFIHLNCMYKKRNKKMIKIPTGKLIQFPVPSPHSVQNILTHLIKQKCGWKDINDKKEQHMLLHHSSHDHPLALIDGPIENGPDLEFDLPEFNNLNINNRLVNQSCNACTLLVLDASFYRCSESCNFILHKWCTELPREIQHPGHSYTGHTLVLHERVVKSFEFFKCRCCKKRGNGFAYKCNECGEYYLDVICASLPSSVKHEYHEHPLILSNDYGHCTCNSCADLIMGEFFFSCDVCHFRLDVNCLLLPKEIRHRYDDHGFKLTDLAPTCNEYYCEFCERKLNPNRWIYHCFECDRSADITCAKSRVFNLFRGPVKFGLSYSHLIDMPPWTCIPIFRDESSGCWKCWRNVFKEGGFGLFSRESENILCDMCYPEYISSQKALMDSHAS